MSHSINLKESGRARLGKVVVLAGRGHNLKSTHTLQLPKRGQASRSDRLGLKHDSTTLGLVSWSTKWDNTYCIAL